MVALGLGGVIGEGCVGDGRDSAECSLQKPEGERDSVWERELGDQAGDDGDNGGEEQDTGKTGQQVEEHLGIKFMYFIL